MTYHEWLSALRVISVIFVGAVAFVVLMWIVDHLQPTGDCEEEDDE